MESAKKRKMELFLIYMQHLFVRYIELCISFIIIFPLYAWCKILYRDNVRYRIPIKSKNFRLCHVCNTTDDKRFLNKIVSDLSIFWV